MARRFVKFRNYRNIGVSNEEELFEKFHLNSSLEKDSIGELIIVIGENNVGKSNILDAINVITGLENLQYVPLSESDVTDFMGYEDGKPSIKLVYDGVDGKSFDMEYFLNDEGDAQVRLGEGGKAFEIARIKKQLSEESIKEIKAEFAAKFSAYAEQIKRYNNNYGGGYLEQFNALANSYNSIIADTEGIDIKKLKNAYSKLKELLDKFANSYNYQYAGLNHLDFIDLDTIIYYTIKNSTSKESLQAVEEIASGTLKEKYGIRLVPQIVYYKEEEIEDDDLITTPAAIKDSKFFNSLFKAAGKNISTITQAYEKAKKTPGFKNKYQNSINEKLREIVNKKFNELYFQGLPTQDYNFYITLEENRIYLSMEKNNDIITLSKQSTGFRWFFNFFFNFLHAADLQPGDIVLMDEPEIHLAIRGKQELRAFLKDFAKRSGITFVATTHHTEFIDPDFLDELRIVKQKKDGKVGAGIQNDFSAIGEDEADTINEILCAFGVDHRDIITNPNNTVIYVEGITDYNYLTAFKRLKEAEEGKKIALAFLPIGGLGEDDAQMKRKLLLLARHKDAVLLTDSDRKAEIFAGICGTDAVIKDRLAVLQLKEFGEGFAEIESLFAPADKERHKEMIEGKIGSASALFKRNILELSQKGEIDGQTKANFYKVLDYLAGVN